MNNQMISKLFQVMQSRGINIPQGVNMNNPNSILQYLMQNGKITQQQYNNAYQQYRSMFGNGMNNQQYGNNSPAKT